VLPPSVPTRSAQGPAMIACATCRPGPRRTLPPPLRGDDGGGCALLLLMLLMRLMRLLLGRGCCRCLCCARSSVASSSPWWWGDGDRATSDNSRCASYSRYTSWAVVMGFKLLRVLSLNCLSLRHGRSDGSGRAVAAADSAVRAPIRLLVEAGLTSTSRVFSLPQRSAGRWPPAIARRRSGRRPHPGDLAAVFGVLQSRRRDTSDAPGWPWRTARCWGQCAHDGGRLVMRASAGSTHGACRPHFSSTRAVSARMEGGPRACGVAADRWWYCGGGSSAPRSLRCRVWPGVCGRGKLSPAWCTRD
jgi:hypothetical protein